MNKCFKYNWVKSNQSFLGIYGTKNTLAHDLLLMKDIKLTKSDCQKLDIRNSSSKEILRLTVIDAAKFLESKGWKWQKIKSGV